MKVRDSLEILEVRLQGSLAKWKKMTERRAA